MSDTKKLLSERLQYVWGLGSKFDGTHEEIRILESELAAWRAEAERLSSMALHAGTDLARATAEANDWRKAAEAAVTARKLAEKDAENVREMLRTARHEVLQEALEAVGDKPYYDPVGYAGVAAIEALLAADATKPG